MKDQGDNSMIKGENRKRGRMGKRRKSMELHGTMEDRRNHLQELKYFEDDDVKRCTF